MSIANTPDLNDQLRWAFGIKGQALPSVWDACSPTIAFGMTARPPINVFRQVYVWNEVTQVNAQAALNGVVNALGSPYQLLVRRIRIYQRAGVAAALTDIVTFANTGAALSSTFDFTGAPAFATSQVQSATTANYVLAPNLLMRLPGVASLQEINGEWVVPPNFMLGVMVPAGSAVLNTVLGVAFECEAYTFSR